MNSANSKRITLQKWKNRIISLADVNEDFINNLDDDHFTNICNDIQYELYRLYYNVYGEDMYQTYNDFVVPQGQGYYDFSSGSYDYYMPFAILRIDRLNAENRRIPMERFDLIQKNMDTSEYSWEGTNVEYDFRPPRLYFHPINQNEETFRLYYIPKPTVLVSNDGYVSLVTEEHIELATIMVAMHIFTKEQTSFTELEKLYNIYMERLKKMPPRDHGKPKHIIDVQGHPGTDRLAWLDDWYQN